MRKLAIGEMARICNVSIQTLRYYDKINLIKPAGRNPENNYRYYLIAQVFQVNIVKYLRYSGFSIDRIRKSLNLRNDDLAGFLAMQQTNIDDQIHQLNNSRQLISGQIEQLNELAEIKKHITSGVYQRYIPEKKVLQLVADHKITPLDYPDKETGELDQILIENGTVGNLQYGFSFPLLNYQQISDIEYEKIFTRVFTINDLNLSTIPSGNYLCISFYWDRAKYFDYYQELRKHFLKNFRNSPNTVYEISSVDNYGYPQENQFITELHIKIPSSENNS